MSKQIEHVQLVSTLSKGRNFSIESFDIVAVCGNKVECCFDIVERCFDNVACFFDIVAGVDGALVFQYLAKRLAGKNDSEMTYFVSGGT